MDILNSRAEEIYRKFGDEKVVSGVKNPDLKIKLGNLRGLVYIILIVIVFLNNLDYIEMYEEPIRSMLFVGGSIAIVLAIYFFLKGSYKIYYKSNYLIFENKLGSRTIFDINKYPRIYIRYRKYKEYNSSTEEFKNRKRYDLHLEQKDTNIALDIGDKRIKQLLNNLETKEKDEVDENIWELSVNKREKIFVDYIDFLKSKKQIVGIKDTNKNMKISKSISIIFKFLICVFIVCAISVIYLIIKRIYFIGTLISLLLPVLLFVLKEEKREIYLEISYPTENIIKINKKDFYIEDGYMLYLEGKQNPESVRKYDYTLKIANDIHEYTININSAKAEEICAIIDNLEFE